MKSRRFFGRLEALVHRLFYLIPGKEVPGAWKHLLDPIDHGVEVPVGIVHLYRDEARPRVGKELPALRIRNEHRERVELVVARGENPPDYEAVRPEDEAPSGKRLRRKKSYLLPDSRLELLRDIDAEER